MDPTTVICCEIHAGFCLMIGFLVFMNKLLNMSICNMNVIIKKIMHGFLKEFSGKI